MSTKEVIKRFAPDTDRSLQISKESQLLLYYQCNTTRRKSKEDNGSTGSLTISCRLAMPQKHLSRTQIQL